MLSSNQMISQHYKRKSAIKGSCLESVASIPTSPRMRSHSQRNLYLQWQSRLCFKSEREIETICSETLSHTEPDDAFFHQKMRSWDKIEERWVASLLRQGNVACSYPSISKRSKEPSLREICSLWTSAAWQYSLWGSECCGEPRIPHTDARSDVIQHGGKRAGMWLHYWRHC